MSLGVLGGTFNPVHYAHLRLGEEAREQLGLVRLLFVPTGRPALKQEQLAPARDRVEMVRLATASNPAFEVLDLELERSGPSYTVDTLREIARRFPEERLWFIVGADVLCELDRWREPETLFGLASLAVASRPGSTDAPAKLLPEALLALFEPGPNGLVHASGNEIRALPFPALEISASEVRRRIARGISVRYLVPDAVLDYIRKHRLYEEGV